MKTYVVQKKTDIPEESFWETANAAEISLYPWGGAYCPAASAVLVCCGDRFVLHMRALERQDYLREQEKGLSGFVHEDSCMEFFFCPLPDRQEYINFEINPAGAAHIAVGKDRNDRERVQRLVDAEEFTVTTFRCEAGQTDCEWGFTAQLSFGLIARLMGVNSYTPPESLSGNFYICGDKTPEPHFGVWNPIDLPAPDYHRPEFFGRLQMSASS